MDYFTNIFKSSSPNDSLTYEALSSIPVSVSEQMNDHLLAHFTVEGC